MSGKIVSSCQDSNNVNNNYYKVTGKSNTILKAFNEHHIKNTCFASAIFGSFFYL